VVVRTTALALVKGVDEDRDYLTTTEKESKTETILGTCEEHERIVNGKLFSSPRLAQGKGL
jgi:hypothetical protein